MEAWEPNDRQTNRSVAIFGLNKHRPQLVQIREEIRNLYNSHFKGSFKLYPIGYSKKVYADDESVASVEEVKGEERKKVVSNEDKYY